MALSENAQLTWTLFVDIAEGGGTHPTDQERLAVFILAAHRDGWQMMQPDELEPGLHTFSEDRRHELLNAIDVGLAVLRAAGVPPG
jgi:hypothetical protein